MPRLRGRPKGYPKSGGRQPGTPNKVTKPIKAIAEPFGEAAVGVLAAIMTDPLAPHAARVSAAQALLDRGFGKAHQTSDLNLNDQRSYIRVSPKMDHAEWAQYLEFKRSQPATTKLPQDKPKPLPAADTLRTQQQKQKLLQ